MALRRLRVCGILMASQGVVGFCLPLVAQTAPDPLTPEIKGEIVTSLASLLAEEYVLEDVGQDMGVRLEDRLASGEYRQITDQSRFALALTDDLRSVYNDRHLGVLEPARYEEWKLRLNAPHGAERHGGAYQSGGISASCVMNRDGRTDVGYLRLSRFDGSADGLESANAVMNLFIDVDALIFDLRQCPGGDAAMVSALSSYLFAEPTHLVSTVQRGGDEREWVESQRWTAPTPLGEALADTPVYVLTSEQTFSAAESFSFGLKRTGRATLVGDSTGGGGHMNDLFDLPAGFGVSVSVGRTYDPVTGEGWQSSGVTPDVPCQSDHALATALDAIAKASVERARLTENQAAVHATMQSYANAWYTGDADTMRALLDERFRAHHVRNGVIDAESADAFELVQATHDGVGLATPRALRNRVITVDKAFDKIASGRLMLRETMHYMQLVRIDDEWRIILDVFADKPRH